jgi:outer membrane murein-binding lipoprotein Lpp
MKKVVLGLTLLFLGACANPSMERGFESLNQEVAELASAIDDLDINGLNEQMSSIAQDLETAEADINAYALTVEEHIARIAELQATFDAMALQIQGMTEIVDGMIISAEGLATSEQFQKLLADMNEFQQGINVLVGSADYDSDGVSNALDKCPDTELGKTVDSDGCSSDQL